MVVNLSFKNPFAGVVFVQNHFASAECRWRGNGSHFLLIVVPLPAQNSSSIDSAGSLGKEKRESEFCGMVEEKASGEHSATLVISPDAEILTEDAFALTVRCVQTRHDLVLTLGAPSMDPSFRILKTETMTVMGNGGAAPSLTLRILDGHGIIGRNVSEAVVGQRLTLDVQLEDTSIYDLFVHECLAHDGTHNREATIAIVDSNGCAVRLPRAVDAPVLMSSPQKNAAKHVYVHIYGFQFTSSELVHFECQVTPCINSCDIKQCGEGSSVVKSNPPPKFPAYLAKTIVQIIPQKRASSSQVALNLIFGRNNSVRLAMAQALYMEQQPLLMTATIAQVGINNKNTTSCDDSFWTVLTLLIVLLSLIIVAFGLWKFFAIRKKALILGGIQIP